MLKFFKHTYMAQLVVIVLLIVALWLPVFLSSTSPVFEDNPTTPLFNILTNDLGLSPFFISLLTFAVFIVSVFFFNSMMSVNQMVTRNSSIGALMFVLCVCGAPLCVEYYPFLIAGLFIMMSMQTVYLIYLVEKPEMYLMNAGFFLSLATMFYFPSIILILWLLISMMIMRMRGFRLYVIPLVGFILPYFVLFAIFYFTKTLIKNIGAYTLIFNNLSFETSGWGTVEIVTLLIVGVLFVLSFMIIKSEDADNSISTRKKTSSTVLLMLFSVVMLFLKQPVFSNGLIFIVLAVFLSTAFCYVRKSKIIDILIIVMMVVVIVNQYLPLFGIRL